MYSPAPLATLNWYEISPQFSRNFSEFSQVLAAYANYLILDADTFTTIDALKKTSDGSEPNFNCRNGGPDQQFVFTKESDGFYTIRNFANNLLLEGCGDRVRMTSSNTVTDCHKWNLVFKRTQFNNGTETPGNCPKSQELRSDGTDT